MFTEGLPTAANSAGQSAASILRATLTTTSANCAEWTADGEAQWSLRARAA